MLFINRKEVNYELYYKNTFIRIILNKKNYSNKYIIKKPQINLFFWFKKIKEENLDLIKLYNHCIFLWLITGDLAKIINLNSKLSRGIKYYRYKYFLKISNFFKFLNFINEIFYSIIYRNTIYKHLRNNENFLISYSDLSIFTNLKLLNSFYLNSVHTKLFLNIKMKNNNLNIYLNCLKI